MERPIQTEADQSGGVEAKENKNPRSLARRLGVVAFKSGLAVSSGLMSGNLLATVWPTEVQFGPGTAQATLSADGQSTIDAGVSAARKELPDQYGIGPLRLGVNLRLNEIPTLPEDAVEPSDSEENVQPSDIFSSEDEVRVRRYSELYRSLEADAAQIPEELSEHVGKLSLASMMLIVGAYTAVGSKNRKRILQRVTSKPHTLILPLAALSLAVPNLPYAPSRQWEKVSSAYNDTPLEGAEFSGAPAQELINRYGERILRYIRETDKFYADALKRAEDTLAKKTLLGQRFKDEDRQIVLFYTDNHCNVGTPQILALTAREADADVAIDGGDTSFTGSDYEGRCVDALTDAFMGADVEGVHVAGNHDSPFISRKFVRAGFTTLRGEIVDFNDDLLLLGDDDPRSSQFGQGLRNRSSLTISELGVQLAEKACENGRQPLLVIHDPKAAVETVERGCSDLALTGHTHKRKIVDYVREDGTIGYIVTGGSSGGATEQQLTYGPLNAPSEFMLIAIENGQLVSYQDFKLKTDGSLEISRITDL